MNIYSTSNGERVSIPPNGVPVTLASLSPASGNYYWIFAQASVQTIETTTAKSAALDCSLSPGGQHAAATIAPGSMVTLPLQEALSITTAVSFQCSLTGAPGTASMISMTAVPATTMIVQ